MDFLDPKIQAYSEAHTSPEPALLAEIVARCEAEREDKSMLSGFYQGRLLAMLSKMTAPRRILEIGTYLGFSALCLAEGLRDDGRLITLDVSEETNAIARGYWARSPLGAKIDPRLGPAAEIIPTLDEEFDLVFIDADKPGYIGYYDLVFPKLKVGGMIVADNVLRRGEVVRPAAEHDENARALDAFNRKVAADERVFHVLLAVRDGLMIVRKEKE